MKVDKESLIMGAGASVGVIQTIVMKEYVDPQFGNIPYIGGMLPAPWGRWSTLGNIVIGGVFFGLSQFTRIIEDKSYAANSFLKLYGITTLVGGIMNGIFPGTAAARLSAPRAGGIRLTGRPVARAASTLTPTGIPMTKVLS